MKRIEFLKITKILKKPLFSQNLNKNFVYSKDLENFEEEFGLPQNKSFAARF